MSWLSLKAIWNWFFEQRPLCTCVLGNPRPMPPEGTAIRDCPVHGDEALR